MEELFLHLASPIALWIKEQKNPFNGHSFLGSLTIFSISLFALIKKKALPKEVLNDFILMGFPSTVACSLIGMIFRQNILGSVEEYFE